MSESLTKRPRVEDAAAEPEGDIMEVEIKSRDFTAKQEEEAGILQFKTVWNDGTPTNLRFLCELKEIFGQQLPKMPKEYIVRLVFCKRHKSVCAIKRGGGLPPRVIGGICYRPYLEQRFGEIAFCAIKTEEQVRGYGTRLMNQTKHLSKTLDKIDHFLTYADNYAIGYFKKQGFHMHITMERGRWAPFIKDYEGGTLMECYINPNIPYLEIPAMVRKQRKVVEDKISSMTKHHQVYPGLQCFKQGVKSIELDAIPGVKAVGFTYASHLQGAGVLTERESNPTILAQTLSEILANTIKFEHSWPFREPVNPEEVPDYQTVIKDPVDLSLMQRRLSEGFYKTKDIFWADLYLMCENCRTYNPRESIYYECAVNVQRFCECEMRRLGLM
mmetsp:Transcript_43760/g.106998  ORF Transcript_43760/g.106998 Transcript_43760/m.106998 type:complete len:386 (+) Transcript_43760:108-1265(+)|eukprot:CAMPEP_0206251370 /NCGR_PEP_ID=MMETSP0047_2-20121206/21990_1 /ASSEMBLY_ACC=CAM_ASM_000192 /TAXON_ID=195065 /ORGANISM="Chroomonas mesostigmatica_cf, Strain CCMP1168" /LENGTH=385 /DNA_ID=CAMNT_0053677323 /DNA_START=52 /DNA_END=1209 /DNA_ORIENTATION=-